ncbi:MAG: pentapeptide repeat-containing protein [Planctomycetota bacterium]|nr:pentapeptide repeat-containing protein [Planctomycetota bacterium]
MAERAPPPLRRAGGWGARITRADFSKTSTGTGLTPAQLVSTADYKQADLSGLILGGNNLSGCNLSGRNLTGTSFTSATLTGANFTDAQAAQADFSGTVARGFTPAQLYSTGSYKNSHLRGIRLGGNNLSQWNLAGQNLTDADFDGATLAITVFTGADLAGANFRTANLANADLTDAWIAQADFSAALGFSPAQLYSTASYESHDLHGVRFGGSVAASGALNPDNLGNWNLAGQDLTDSLLASANSANTDLTGADLRGAPGLTRSRLAVAITRNAIRPDGRIPGLRLADGETLLIRDYEGRIPITIQGVMELAEGSVFQILLRDPTWGSTISFEPGTLLSIAGDLKLSLAADVDPDASVGHTFKLFDWADVGSTAGFHGVLSDLQWDTSRLYSTGEVTLVGLVPEPGCAAVVVLGALACLGRWRHRLSRCSCR